MTKNQMLREALTEAEMALKRISITSSLDDARRTARDGCDLVEMRRRAIADE